MNAPDATVIAGIPALNMALYHRIRFLVGDPAALVVNGTGKTLLILRDIEMDRARRQARVDEVACPADFEPDGGLSGDRETATAQATAEALRRHGASSVRADRTLPLIYVDHLRRAGIGVQYDEELGVVDRRAKDEQEVEYLREAQGVTEEIMERVCRMIAAADTAADGSLVQQGEPLTSEWVRAFIDGELSSRGYSNPGSIVAGGPVGADCHDYGRGPLRTGEPIIVDIFPRNRTTLYNGDCTRTVVHGEISTQLRAMHAAVVEAKAAAIARTRAGVTGEEVHAATLEVIRRRGFDVGLPPEDAPDSYCAMVHGTGHGIGLEVHEPPLLDRGGPPLVAGDALTNEPGLYCKALGGIRVEDMVIVRENTCENLNRLPESLEW